MFVYKIDVLKELNAAGYNSIRLRKEKLLGESTIQKLRNNEMVGIHYLDTICTLLNKQPGQIIKHISDPKQ